MLYVALLLFFFNDTATTEIYTLSLHDALPIFIPTASDRDRSGLSPSGPSLFHNGDRRRRERTEAHRSTAKAVGIIRDRKSTRLNSSHANISYAVFCLKTKNILLMIFVICCSTI